MHETLAVSVIIPVFNRGHTIKRALESVLAQTFQDFEVVVVDDGSTDNTIDVVDSFQNDRFRLIRHEMNRGPAAARNSGVENARGIYLAFLDSDDEWLPTKLEEQVAALRSADHTVRACTIGFLLVQDGKVQEKYPEPITPLQKKMLWGCDFGPGTTLMVDHAAFDEIGSFNEQMPRFEDWDWLIRYAEKFEIIVLHKTLARVFRSSKPSPEKVETSTLLLVEKYKDHFGSFGPGYQRQVLSRRWREVAWGYYEMGRNLPKERLYFWRTICTYPFQPINVYVALVDSLLGTRLKTWASQLKARLLKK